MVTISSYCLTESVQVVSREHLTKVCSAIIELFDAVGKYPSLRTMMSAPFIRIECECGKVFVVLTYHVDITLGELLNSLPLNIDYSPIKIPTNHGREKQQKSVD